MIAQIKGSQVRDLDINLLTEHQKQKTLPATETAYIHIENANAEEPILTVFLKFVCGWYWRDAGPSPQERIADSMAKAVESEAEGDKWKAQ